MRPLGTDYVSVLHRAFSERWLDWYPAEGKRSGAYSNGGAYDVHPYILLNYLGQYNDVSTLAHELGHTMHSYYSNKTQPYATGGLPDVRRGSGVDVQRGAADRLHAEADQGRADAAVAARQLSRKHQGHRIPADAVCRVRAADARNGAEGRADYRRCARQAVLRHHQALLRPRSEASSSSTTTSRTNGATFPHFYSDFYVFQYATSFTAAQMLAAQVLAGDAAATDALSDVHLAPEARSIPIDLLKEAGVDMTTDEPLDHDDADDEPRDGRDRADSRTAVTELSRRHR